MKDFLKRLTSRKFLAMVGVSLVALGSALAGETTWATAINQVVAVVIAYIAAEGTADVVTRMKE